MKIPDHVLALAKKLSAQHSSWTHIAAVTGYSSYVLRRAIEPGFSEIRRGQAQERRHDRRGVRSAKILHFSEGHHLSAEVAARALATVPVDTRGFTARAMGDPLPGRSALDRKAHATGVIVKPLASPLTKKMVIDDVFRTIEMEDRHSNFEAVD